MEQECLLFDNVEKTFNVLFKYFALFASFPHIFRLETLLASSMFKEKLCVFSAIERKNQRKSSETSIKSESEQRRVRLFIDGVWC